MDTDKNSLRPYMAELLGKIAAGGATADHHGWVGLDLAVANGAEQGQRRLGPQGDADRQSRAGGPFVGRPDADR